MKQLLSRLAPGLLLATLMLAGCERLGIPDPAKTEAQAEADGKAIGSACRHAGRAIEDCFTLYPNAQRSAIFAGWKEMNDYMAENKIEAVTPQLPPPAPPTTGKGSKSKEKATSDGDGKSSDKAEAADDEHAQTDEAPAEDAPPARKRRRATD